MSWSTPLPASAELDVAQLAAMDSLRLAQFIGGRENANGAYHLPVDGWDGLSKDERESCAARFKSAMDPTRLFSSDLADYLLGTSKKLWRGARASGPANSTYESSTPVFRSLLKSMKGLTLMILLKANIVIAQRRVPNHPRLTRTGTPMRR